MVLGAPSAPALGQAVDALALRVEAGWCPPVQAPAAEARSSRERLAIDYADGPELLDRLRKAQRALASGSPSTWKAYQAQGMFRGSGPARGKVAFLFTGQGSQYVAMGQDLAAAEPVVRAVFDEADRVLGPVLGYPLSQALFVDRQDAAAVARAEAALAQTTVLQAAVLALDTALARLLADFGLTPDLVMGHSLGEYGALVAAGVLTFAEALQVVAARSREMADLHFADPGALAAVMASPAVVAEVLATLPGYVVQANHNARSQVVIGGQTAAVERAVAAFGARGLVAQRLPVSHAFHTDLVAPTAPFLRAALERCVVRPPSRPLVGNTTAEPYPAQPEAIVALLCRQIAAPVRWVEGVERLYAEGVRTFVEVGPQRTLKGLVDDILTGRADVLSLFTNRPSPRELASFNQALAGLYAAGQGPS